MTLPHLELAGTNSVQGERNRPGRRPPQRWAAAARPRGSLAQPPAAWRPWRAGTPCRPPRSSRPVADNALCAQNTSSAHHFRNRCTRMLPIGHLSSASWAMVPLDLFLVDAALPACHSPHLFDRKQRRHTSSTHWDAGMDLHGCKVRGAAVLVRLLADAVAGAVKAPLHER